MIKKIWAFYGFRDEKPDYSGVNYRAVNDSDITESGIEDKITYLKDIAAFEENRQTAIENKIAQIIGQGGVVLSLAGLFIPLFFDKLDGIELWKKIVLVGIFAIAIFFYLLSILKATQSYQINNYSYATGDPDTVTKYKMQKALRLVIVKDLIYACKISEISNNHKATKLLYANNAFKSGSIAMGALLIFFCAFIITYKASEPVSQVKITNVDSIIVHYRNIVIPYTDSLIKKEFNKVSESINELNETVEGIKTATFTVKKH